MTAMSGSYDRPDRTGSRLPQSGQRAPDYDPYDEPVTGFGSPLRSQQSAAYPGDADYPPPDPTSMISSPIQARPYPDPDERNFSAPARSDRKGRLLTTPIVPQGSVTGRSLTLVITIMCFLACLTAGTVYMIRQTAEAWLKDIASEITVQVEPIAKDKGDMEKLVQEITSFLTSRKGIVSAKAFTVAESSALLEPWLGSSDALKELPVPRLIAIVLDQQALPDLSALKSDIESKFPNANLDDHRHWQQQIRSITHSFALGGVAILALVAAATMAIIISATKSSMASNREIVEVLHFVGATDRFIAREFEKHFLRLGIRAGLVGAAFAILVFGAMPIAVQVMGGGSITVAELNRFIGPGTLDLAGFILMGIVVVVVAALCMLTSRFGVFRILNSKS